MICNKPSPSRHEICCKTSKTIGIVHLLAGFWHCQYSVAQISSFSLPVKTFIGILAKLNLYVSDCKLKVHHTNYLCFPIYMIATFHSPPPLGFSNSPELCTFPSLLWASTCFAYLSKIHDLTLREADAMLFRSVFKNVLVWITKIISQKYKDFETKYLV